jgi:hypothetical protein
VALDDLLKVVVRSVTSGSACGLARSCQLARSNPRRRRVSQRSSNGTTNAGMEATNRTTRTFLMSQREPLTRLRPERMVDRGRSAGTRSMGSHEGGCSYARFA